MGWTTEELLKDRVFFHFYQICQIPHGSGNEKAISSYILRWAQGLGLDAVQDEADNVFIRKAASPGYESAPVVMLQAHMDMVCEKAADADHDFLTDPIDWVIDGDQLSTGGKTTLGGDDGIGVALAMAVLEAQGLAHPALEVLFTTMEEEDLSGAERFDKSKLKARYLINLDHDNDREVLCGSCGGMQVDVRIPVEPQAVEAGWEPYRLAVSGLKGGHSGDDIHRGRGNANILLTRMLMAVEDCCGFRIHRIRGGSFRLAIPRDAEAVIWLPAGQAGKVREALERLQAQIRAELAVTADRVKLTLESTQAEPWGTAPRTVLDAMALMPDGIFQMNEMLTGQVDTSDNLGEIYLDERELHLVLEIRSARDSLREFLFRRMERLARLLGGTCRWSNAYPSWDFHPVSPLRELCSRVYEQTNGEKPAFRAIHAGLEVGYFFGTGRNMDAVAIGANCRDFHSPSETVQISSVKKIYGCLCDILAAIK